MKKIIPLLLSILFASNISGLAQPPLKFAKTFGGPVTDESNDIKVDAFGNSYTIGSFRDSADFDTGPGVSMVTSNGQLDIFIMKLDSLGNFVWSKRIGGTENDKASSLVLDPSGNLYITGSFASTVDFDPGGGTLSATSPFLSAFILKMDPLGNPLWLKTFHGSNSVEYCEGFAITLDNLGNVICYGNFLGSVDFDPGAGTTVYTELDIGASFLLKLDNMGTFVFAKEILCKEYIFPKCVKTDAGGNIYTCGSFTDSLDGDPGVGTAWLVSPDGYYEGYVSKYSSSGNHVWSKALGTHPFTPFTRAYSVGLDAVGNVYVCGHFAGTCDFDPGSGTSILVSTSSISVYSVKLDNSGNFIWGREMGGEDAQAYGMYVDPSGNQVITGTFAGDLDCDPSASAFTLYSHASPFDVFLLILNSSGYLECAFNVGSTFHDYGNAIDVRGSDLYMTGVFSLTCDFDPGSLYDPHTSAGFVDAYIAKYDAASCLPVTVDIDAVQKKEPLNVFPNPVSDKLIIQWQGRDAKYSLINSLGQHVENRVMEIGENRLDVSDIPSGVYFLMVETGEGVIYRKIIKK